jgi:ribosomal protein S18 acetylase RimI-like enzyme
MFADAFEDYERYLGNRPSDAYLEALLARDTFIALAAFKDVTVVGGLCAYVLPKYEQAHPEIYIYDLAVSAAHRKQGIATALIRELQNSAKVIGASVIFVQADEEDIDAIELYTSFAPGTKVEQFDIPPTP